MRCPYCREEIHDQALKCPHCQTLLVAKPGWQRNREGNEPGSGSPGGAARTGGRRRTRVMLTVLMVAVLTTTAGVLGYRFGWMASDPPVTDPPVEFVSGEAELIAELEAVAERQSAEIRRLRHRLERAASATPAPARGELMAALGFCDQAFAMLIDREEALFADRPALVDFVGLTNQCLAPIGQQVEIPT